MPHRYFTAEVGNGRAALNGTDAHHLADVMRAKIGENVILCDAHAVEYVGTITSIQPGRVEFTVTEGYPSAAEPSVEVTLFAGYPKLGKLEDTIRHSVELGVTNVVPFFSRYCVAAPKKEEAKNERYCRVAVEAAKQCGRGILPTVELSCNSLLISKSLFSSTISSDSNLLISSTSLISSKRYPEASHIFLRHSSCFFKSSL